MGWHTRESRRRDTGRRYYMDDDEFVRVESSRCATVKKSLDLMNVERMVIGHCPQRNGLVEVSCSGRYVVADTYMSTAYTGSREKTLQHMSALEFYSQDTPGRAWIVYPGRSVCEPLPDVVGAWGNPHATPVHTRARSQRPCRWSDRLPALWKKK